MQCKCLKKDGQRCTFKAKENGYCGRHQGCTTPISGKSKTLTIKKKIPSSKKPPTAKSQPLKIYKRFPITKVKEFLVKHQSKVDLETTTLKKFREKAERETGVDLSSKEFKDRFKELVFKIYG